MTKHLADEIAALGQLTPVDLQAKYLDVFGRPTRSRHRRQLVRQIAWRLQAVAEGDLSQRASRRAAELANHADLRIIAPAAGAANQKKRTKHRRQRRKLMPGTLLRRMYKGRLVEVRVLEAGFEYEGRFFASLAGLVKAITGSHWNGYHFFGLTKQGACA